ncbi:MAG: hypothetical protein AVDCRST_MAG85-2003, partial [uncultured Solirubrobacteraceae bacterium]
GRQEEDSGEAGARARAPGLPSAPLGPSPRAAPDPRGQGLGRHGRVPPLRPAVAVGEPAALRRGRARPDRGRRLLHGRLGRRRLGVAARRARRGRPGRAAHRRRRGPGPRSL